MDKKALLKSIPEGEERLLFAKALDQAYFCMKRREPAFTDFMDRAKCGRFAERLRNVGEFRTVLFGGMEDCERLMRRRKNSCRNSFRFVQYGFGGKIRNSVSPD